MLFPGKILLLSPHRLFLYSMLKDGCVFLVYFSAQSLKMNQPEFLTPLRNHTVEVGKNVTFECYVTGIEKYKVSIFLLSFKISHASRLSLHKRGVVLKKDSMTPPFPSKKLKEAVFHGVFGLGCWRTTWYSKMRCELSWWGKISDEWGDSEIQSFLHSSFLFWRLMILGF